MSRPRLGLFAGLLTAVAVAVASAPSGPAAVANRGSAVDCPPGFRPAGRTEAGNRDPVTAQLLAATRPDVPVGCLRVDGVEKLAELMKLGGETMARQAAPFDTVAAGAREAAIAQRRALVAQQGAIPGTGGEWEPVGKGPLISNGEDYDEINGLGLVNLAGRIQDFQWDPRRNVVYVSVAMGGVYKSTNRGDSWTSISDTLPNLTVGSVAWSPHGGGVGTLVVITGDSNSGGNSVPGTGAYWSTDEGATWHKSVGVPDGLLGYKIAADPTNPAVFYAGTGGGLFRSADAGRTFVNVELPTGNCAGEPAVHPCFFANHVTDVVVQAPDNFGNDGGKVLAAVGWRAGAWPDDAGQPQATHNGLYSSASGEPGSFTKLTAAGFTVQDRIGRIELGAAEGDDQDHNIVYAIVQDAAKLNGGAAPGGNEITTPVVGYNTVLEGIYVTTDFGQTWVQMQDGEALAQAAAAEGSALGVTAQALGYGPGVQAWYNMFIKPDPFRTDATTHAPTRLLFGLEEVWQNEDTFRPQLGRSSFKVIGRYFGGDTCFFLSVNVPVCPPYRGEPQGGTTTHPDQHGVIFLPGEDEGAVDLLVGNDGGVYRQRVAAGEEFTNTKWGDGHNAGFHTLMPYSVAVARDGVIWSGLQDNGHMRINTDGTQYMTYGGDGTWSAVDPEDSAIAYEAVPGGAMSATSDGGQSWNSIDPELTGAAFVNQFALDPRDSSHLVTAGREIKVNADAPGASWTTVWDLGTVTNPGEEPAPTDSSLPNRMSAIAVDGDAIYVGWCGICDVVTQNGTFKSGIATNVGGEEDPEFGSSAGWHFAEGRGLPNRLVTSVAIDPQDRKTIYVTLGGYSRRWVPPGANGDAAENVGTGHVYKSTDAGESFVDITGNLPDTPTNWLLVRNQQLLVATDVGVFASGTRNGGSWALLGREYDLPLAPVLHLALRPGSNELYAAVHGRGIQRYRFAGATAPTPGPTPTRPAPTRPPVAVDPRPLPSTGPGPMLPLAALIAAAGAVGVTRRRRTAAGR